MNLMCRVTWGGMELLISGFKKKNDKKVLYMHLYIKIHFADEFHVQGHMGWNGTINAEIQEKK